MYCRRTEGLGASGMARTPGHAAEAQWQTLKVSKTKQRKTIRVLK